MIANAEENAVSAHADRSAAEVLLNCVRLRTQRRLLWLRSEWGEPQESRPWAISETEVEQILEDPAEVATREELFYRSDAIAQRLSERICEADLEFSQLPDWRQVRQQFALSASEVNLLVLAVALGADPRLSRVYAFLQDDANAGYATPRLAAALFQTPPLPLDSDSSLLRWRLVTPAEDSPGHRAWLANTSWTADPYIVLWLLDRRGLDPALSSAAVRLLPCDECATSIYLYPQLLARMTEFVEAIRKSWAQGEAALSDAIEIELVGAAGTGKHTLAAQCAASFGFDLLAVDGDALLDGASPTQAAEITLRVRRMASLTGAALYWAQSEWTSQHPLKGISGNSRLTFFGVQRAGPIAGRSPAPRRSFLLPPLRREMRSALWQHISSYPVPPVIEDWILTPAEIAAAAQAAPAGLDAVVEVCRENLRGVSRELFVTLPCPFTWDDIVLSSHTRQHLAELEQQVKLRWHVYQEWGFEHLCAFGSGITAMFSGPSGTGKTMAAQVMARSLNMQLYRVDLAGVMNKYIGETEKRLKQVFDACERANVLLFFDEADALFGQRTQVKDAHDRFANIEIDYLLQRMEQFEGVAILATNRKSDLDKAFVRRIRFMVDFQQPGPPERRALWQRALQQRSPSGEELLGDIDWDFLAQKLEMTGADIASAALNSAFLARAEGSYITMAHIVHAARREMSKHGAVLRPGDWEA